MTVYSQADRRLIIETPLGADALLLTSFAGTEQLSRLFTYQIELVSENDSINPADLVGKNISFGLRLLDDNHRYINGFVSRFSAMGRGDRLAIYSAEVVPWLWFLTQTTNCRIFQEMSVTDIIEKVFRDRGFSDYELQISGSHPKWEYCVQYRETDFSFVSRLMEQEGIFYFFRHENGKHTLVLADSTRACRDAAENEIRLASNLSQPEPTDNIIAWEHRQEFRSGKYTHTDFNFKTPATNLLATTSTVLRLANMNKFELYDFPGEYETRGQGDNDARLHMEEQEAAVETVLGKSTNRSLGPGFKVKVAKHHIAAEEGKGYILTSVCHQAVQPGSYITGGNMPAVDYINEFTAIPESVAFRPPRITPKPVVRGSQTAIVVGPGGEEIYTDQHGRVKVQFHWDREGKKDDKSSCWVRVAQLWAGKGWGAMFLPRIGQEVIVDFLEGDPDRPIITGRVYNADQTTPYALPDKKTISTIKTFSTPGGGGFNEFRFDDKKGKEQIFIHAEKDEDIRVKNIAKEWIGKDRHLIVKGDQLEKVEGDKHLTVTGDQNEKINGNISQQAGQNIAQKAGMNHAVEAGMGMHLKGGMNVVIEAGMSVTIKAGGGFIVVGPAGVTISGTPVLINSGGAAGSGSGCSPTAPKPPEEADKAEAGQGNSGSSSAPPAAQKVSVLAQALKKASRSGAPLVQSGGPGADAALAGPQTPAPGAAVAPPPGASSTAPAVAASPAAAPKVATGLGPAVDAEVAKSPKFRQKIQQLKDDKWKIEYGPKGKGSYCDKASKTIVIDSGRDTNAALASLAHEAGHAGYKADPPVPAKGLSKEEFVQKNTMGNLKDEGEATLVNAELAQDLKANGGADIKVAGTQAAKYKEVAAKYPKAEDRDKAREEVGNLFAKGEKTSTDPSKNYEQYYGAWYEAQYDKANPGAKK